MKLAFFLGIAGFGFMLLFLFQHFLRDVWGVETVGWSFVMLGAALWFPQSITCLWWETTTAKVTKVVGNGEEVTLSFEYDFEGERFQGAVTETTLKVVGSTIRLHVNPSAPAEHFTLSDVAMLLGVGMTLLGAMLGAGLLPVKVG